jgi:hydrogenase maturation factor
VEIGMQSLRVTGQGSLSAKEYHELMMHKIDDVHESRFKALEEIEKGKIKIAKAYNKRVVEKSFQVGDLVWKMILPLGLEVVSLVNGRLVGKDRLEFSG